MSGDSFGNLVSLAASQPAAIVSEAARGKGAKPEEIYRAWMELAEARIAGEQLLVSGYTLTLGDQGVTGERELIAVLSFFDGVATQAFQRQTDVGELSNYMAADARRWRELLRALRQRSTGAKAASRYQQLTRALAAAEFIASEPISDDEREEFALSDIGADLDESGRKVEISANFLTRLRAPKKSPNVAICLRDANGDVCGEAVFAPPIAEANGQCDELFTAQLAASAEVANVEVSLTRRAVS